MTYGDRIIEIHPSPLVTDAGQSVPTTMHLAMVFVAVDEPRWQIKVQGPSAE